MNPDRMWGGKTERQRFWEKVHKTDLCWLWTGTKIPKGGYGAFGIRPTPWLAHRYAYVLLVGPIPEGMVLDHLCRNSACVNPDHLEPVTNAENVRRGKGATKLHCPVGHLLVSTRRVGRYCLECKSLKRRKPCRGCGGPKERGERRLYCDACLALRQAA